MSCVTQGVLVHYTALPVLNWPQHWKDVEQHDPAVEG